MSQVSSQPELGSRGAILIAVLGLVSALALVLVAVVRQGDGQLSRAAEALAETQGRYAAQAGLAQLRHCIATARYQNGRNTWLATPTHLVREGAGHTKAPLGLYIERLRQGRPAASTSGLAFEVGPCTTRVYVFNLGKGLYRALSLANHRSGTVTSLAMKIQEPTARTAKLAEAQAVFGVIHEVRARRCGAR